MSGATKSVFRSVFACAPNPIGLLKNGVVVDCNRAMLEMFGVGDKAELAGRRVYEMFSLQGHTDGQLSQVKVEAQLQRCVELGRTSFSGTLKRANEDLLSVHVVLQALGGSESPPMVFYIHDISELRANQPPALSRKAYLEEVLESSPVAFMVSDLHTGLVSKVNRAGRLMMGMSDQVCGTMCAHELLANPSDRFKFLRRLNRHGEASGEILLKRLDGTLLHAEVCWRYNPGNNDELLCWGVDITEFVRTQHELELSRDKALKADDAKSEFLSRMSHELRTPMNAILGFGQLLQLSKDKLTTEQNDSVDHILSAGEHLLELIKDVLDFSRVNSAHVSLRIRRISTHETLRGSIALVRPLAREAGISITGWTGFLPDVLADAHWLRQVLVNLLTNAIKYNSRGGTVSLAQEVGSGGKLRIHVMDSGEGIRPQDAQRLFKPFERFSASRPEIHGTGIGLALCKRIIELMGGRIGFESEPGKGSDFWIELFTCEGLIDPAAVAGATSSRILYIEDQLANIESMVEAARKIAGCELITAIDATTGMSLVHSAQPDLIVMDADLSRTGMDEIFDQLKGEAEKRDLPVYGLISDPEAERRAGEALAAFTQLLPSPLRPRDLVRLIESRAG